MFGFRWLHFDDGSSFLWVGFDFALLNDVTQKFDTGNSENALFLV